MEKLNEVMINIKNEILENDFEWSFFESSCGVTCEPAYVMRQLDEADFYGGIDLPTYELLDGSSFGDEDDKYWDLNHLKADSKIIEITEEEYLRRLIANVATNKLRHI